MNKHIQKFADALRKKKYERVDGGALYLSEHKLFARGIFTFDINGEDPIESPNLVVNEGLNYMLAAALRGGSAISAYFLALMGANATPAATWTGATFASLATEFTNYDEPTRPAWTTAAVASQTITNLASKAAFTIGSGGGTVYGAGLLSSAVKGGTAGILVGASKFPTSRVTAEDDIANLGYSIVLSSS